MISHYLNQWWLSILLTHLCITWPQCCKYSEAKQKLCNYIVIYLAYDSSQQWQFLRNSTLGTARIHTREGGVSIWRCHLTSIGIFITKMTVSRLSYLYNGNPHTLKNSLYIEIGSRKPCCFDSLWPSDAIWCQRNWLTLVQVMAWCHQAPSHYLQQYWITISGVLWLSQEMFKISILDMSLKITNLKLQRHLSKANELKQIQTNKIIADHHNKKKTNI